MTNNATRIHRLTEAQKWMLSDISRQIKEHGIEDANLINHWLKPLKLRVIESASA